MINAGRNWLSVSHGYIHVITVHILGLIVRKRYEFKVFCILEEL